jgi:hypothetical protein
MKTTNMWTTNLSRTSAGRRGPDRRGSVLRGSVLGLMLPMALLGGCSDAPPPPTPLKIALYQDWQLQPGDQLEGFKVLGGLGDISIDLQGKSVYAPYAGEAQADRQGCVFLNMPEVPAYLLRLCGLTSPRLGPLRKGEPIGAGTTLQVATLRQHPSGKWAIVEPDSTLLRHTLKPS